MKYNLRTYDIPQMRNAIHSRERPPDPGLQRCRYGDPIGISPSQRGVDEKPNGHTSSGQEKGGLERQATDISSTSPRRAKWFTGSLLAAGTDTGCPQGGRIQLVARSAQRELRGPG